MKVEDYLLDNQNEIFGNDTSQFYEVEKHFKEYTKIKCQELLEIVAEKATLECKKKSQFGKYRKWQKVKEDEEVDLFNYEMQYSVDKDSVLNAVDLDGFCS